MPWISIEVFVTGAGVGLQHPFTSNRKIFTNDDTFLGASAYACANDVKGCVFLGLVGVEKG